MNMLNKTVLLFFGVLAFSDVATSEAREVAESPPKVAAGPIRLYMKSPFEPLSLACKSFEKAINALPNRAALACRQDVNAEGFSRPLATELPRDRRFEYFGKIKRAELALRSAHFTQEQLREAYLSLGGDTAYAYFKLDAGQLSLLLQVDQRACSKVTPTELHSAAYFFDERAAEVGKQAFRFQTLHHYKSASSDQPSLLMSTWSDSSVSSATKRGTLWLYEIEGDIPVRICTFVQH